MTKIKKHLCCAIAAITCISNADGMYYRCYHCQYDRRSMAQSGNGSGRYFKTYPRGERNREAVNPQKRQQTIKWRDGNFSPVGGGLPVDLSPKEENVQRIFTRETAAAFMAYDDFYFWNPLRNFDPLQDIQGHDYLESLKTLYWQTLEIEDALQEVEDSNADDDVIAQIIRAQKETAEQFSKLCKSISVFKRYMPAEQLQDEVRKSLNLFMYPELLISDLQRIDLEEWKGKFSRVYERLIIAKRRFEQLKEIEHWEQHIEQHQTAIMAILEKFTQRDSTKSEKERSVQYSAIGEFVVNWGNVVSSETEKSIISSLSEQSSFYVIHLRIQRLNQELRRWINLNVPEQTSMPLKNIIYALYGLADIFRANSTFRMN